MIEEWWAQCGFTNHDIIHIHASFVSNTIYRLLVFLISILFKHCLFQTLKRFIFISKLITYQTVMSNPCALVLKCRRRSLWGGAPEGGCWATPSSQVATRRLHLDIGWDLEMWWTLLRVSHFVILGMYWPLLASYLGCKLNQLLLPTWNLNYLGNAMFTFLPLKLCLILLMHLEISMFVLTWFATCFRNHDRVSPVTWGSWPREPMGNHVIGSGFGPGSQQAMTMLMSKLSKMTIDKMSSSLKRTREWTDLEPPRAKWGLAQAHLWFSDKAFKACLAQASAY